MNCDEGTVNSGLSHGTVQTQWDRLASIQQNTQVGDSRAPTVLENHFEVKVGLLLPLGVNRRC